MLARTASTPSLLLATIGSVACVGVSVVGPPYDATVDTADVVRPDNTLAPDADTTADATSDDARADGSTVSGDATLDGVDPCGAEAVVDLAGRMPGADGVLHLFGNNQRTASTTVIPTPVGCVRGTGGPHDQGYQLVYRYVMRATAALHASTANPGTAATFDTVLNLTAVCAPTAGALACNDDVSAMETRSTASTRTLRPAGSVVYVVVGGYTPPLSGSLPFGNFELTLREVPPVATGATCSAMDVCAAGAHCVVATAATTATCVADGTLNARCRMTGSACDDGLGCTVLMPNGEVSDDGLGVCRSLAAVSAPCGRTAAGPLCVDGAACVQVGPTMLRCVAVAVETEPNNTPTTAQGVASMSVAFRGAITPGADVDCYGVRVPAMGALVAETFGTCRTRASDTVLRVYTPAGTLLATNDDGVDIGACSRVQQTYLLAGTYAVCVSSYTRADVMPAPIARYELALGVY